MRKGNYFNWVCTFFVLISACSNEPGEIDIRLEFAQGVTQQANITEFVILVQHPPGSAAARIELFPGRCVGIVDGTGESCLESAPCGFLATEPEFSPQISFFNSSGTAQFPEGEIIEVIVCGLDDAHNIIVSGSDANVENTADQSVTITLSDTDLSACNLNLIPSCP